MCPYLAKKVSVILGTVTFTVLPLHWGEVRCHGKETTRKVKVQSQAINNIALFHWFQVQSGYDAFMAWDGKMMAKVGLFRDHWLPL